MSNALPNDSALAVLDEMLAEVDGRDMPRLEGPKDLRPYGYVMGQNLRRAILQEVRDRLEARAGGPELMAMTKLDDARELRRCLLSTMGFLESVCDHMPECPEGFALRAMIEGGWPETLAIADRLVTALGGPARNDDESCAKSFDRGYQVEVLQRREETTGQRDPEAWKQDPAEFMKAYELPTRAV